QDTTSATGMVPPMLTTPCRNQMSQAYSVDSCPFCEALINERPTYPHTRVPNETWRHGRRDENVDPHDRRTFFIALVPQYDFATVLDHRIAWLTVFGRQLDVQRDADAETCFCDGVFAVVHCANSCATRAVVGANLHGNTTNPQPGSSSESLLA